MHNSLILSTFAIVMKQDAQYIASRFLQSQNENVRLHKEIAAKDEYIRFLEEELKALQAELAQECAPYKKRECELESAANQFKMELDATRKALEEERERNAGSAERMAALESENKNLKDANDRCKAERLGLEKQLSKANEELEQIKNEFNLSEQKGDDLKNIAQLLQKKLYGCSSEQTRMLNGELILSGDAADGKALNDIISQVLNEARQETGSESTSAPGKHQSHRIKAGKKNTKDGNSKESNGGIKHKRRFSFTAEVLRRFGIDTSNLPSNAKIIKRKDKESGMDVWVIRVIHYHRSRLTCDEYEIGRFNVPGSDPMSSNYPKTILPKNPIMPSFAAFYLEQKIGYGMSENRILDMIYQMSGRISQSSLNKWMHEIMTYLRKHMQPEMLELMKQSFYRQCDETIITVRSRESKEEPFKYNKEYIHMQLSPELKLVVMEYDRGTRSHEVQEEMFKDSKTKVFTADRAPLYETIVMDLVELGMVRSACWCHARRYLCDAYVSDKRVIKAINIINLLFMIENEINARGLNFKQRLKYRLRYSQPLVAEFIKLLKKWKGDTKEYGALVQRAVNYFLDDEEAFLVFLKYGEVEMHNSASERMFRHLAMGRRNWLTSGSHDGAKNIAFMFSLYEGCKLNGLNFGKYIEDILTRIKEGDTDYVSFIPCNYTPHATRQEDAA